MAGGAKASSSSRDWRAQSRPKTESTGVKYVRRIVLTLLLAGLATALAWLLLHGPGGPAGIRIAVVPVSGGSVLTVPAVPFAKEDSEALKELDVRPPVLDLADIQTVRGIDTLAGKLREGLQKSDTLVVYLAGNCISDTGSDGPAAWLLCSDFTPAKGTNGAESKPAGRYRIRDVLGQIKQCPAKSKLLILDSGYLNYDPRLGLFVNEFPRLLAEDVRAVNDPDLWVLCSCRPLESSHVCGPQKRSVFNYFVTEAFTGAANRGAAGSIWSICLSMCGTAWPDGSDRQSGGTETQTPWLLHRSGAEKPPKDFRLVPVLAQAALEGSGCR